MPTAFSFKQPVPRILSYLQITGIEDEETIYLSGLLYAATRHEGAPRTGSPVRFFGLAPGGVFHA